MITRHISIIVMILFSITFYGCATILAGYEDNVMLTDIPADLKIYDKDNIEIPIQYKTKVKPYYRVSGQFDSTFIVGRYISLRSNVDHLLIFKSAEQNKMIRVYPKLSSGWFVLDLVTLTFVVDMYTGNWNHFDDINYKNIK